MDIEEVAKKDPKKIITAKVNIEDQISDENCNKIIEIFNLDISTKKQAVNLIKSTNCPHLFLLMLTPTLQSSLWILTQLTALTSFSLCPHPHTKSM